MTEKFCGEVDPDDGHNWLRGDRWSDEFMKAYMAKRATDALWQPLKLQKPSRWNRFTYYAWRKWWYAYHEWLHKDCGRYP